MSKLEKIKNKYNAGLTPSVEQVGYLIQRVEKLEAAISSVQTEIDKRTYSRERILKITQKALEEDV